MNERQMINRMLTQPHWLWRQDLEFVQSVSQQLKERRKIVLSARQSEVIRKIYQRFRENQWPRFFRGGSPGTGKRQ
jgi:hypothetical protein